MSVTELKMSSVRNLILATSRGRFSLICSNHVSFATQPEYYSFCLKSMVSKDKFRKANNSRTYRHIFLYSYGSIVVRINAFYFYFIIFVNARFCPLGGLCISEQIYVEWNILKFYLFIS